MPRAQREGIQKEKERTERGQPDDYTRGSRKKKKRRVKRNRLRVNYERWELRKKERLEGRGASRRSAKRRRTKLKKRGRAEERARGRKGKKRRKGGECAGGRERGENGGEEEERGQSGRPSLRNVN